MNLKVHLKCVILSTGCYWNAYFKSGKQAHLITLFLTDRVLLISLKFYQNKIDSNKANFRCGKSKLVYC